MSTSCQQTEPLYTGNVEPLLHEIRHALDRLVNTGEPTIIDLRAMPMAPGELEQLEMLLGEGEVIATLNALGPSEIKETRFSGVWLVTHFNAENEILGKTIEITRIPEILLSQESEIMDSPGNIQEMIDAL